VDARSGAYGYYKAYASMYARPQGDDGRKPKESA